MLETAKSPELSHRGVLCAKCEHLNEWGLNECTRCGGHLYVSCVDCGHRNERVRSRCSSCSRRLHRGFFERFGRKLIGKHISINPVQIFLFLLGIAIVFGIIVFLSNMRLPAF